MLRIPRIVASLAAFGGIACGGDGPTSANPDRLADAFIASNQFGGNPLATIWPYVLGVIDATGTIRGPGGNLAAVGVQAAFAFPGSGGSSQSIVRTFGGVLAWETGDGGTVEALAVVGAETGGFIDGVKAFYWTRSPNAAYTAQDFSFTYASMFAGPPTGDPPTDCGVTVQGLDVTCQVSSGMAEGAFNFTATRAEGDATVTWPQTRFDNLPTVSLEITPIGSGDPPGPDLTGSYSGIASGTDSGQPFSDIINFTLVQSDSMVTGTWGGRGASGTITGTVRGTTATFTLEQNTPCPGSFAGNATIENDGDRLAGSYSGSYCAGTVSATFTVDRI